MKKVIILGLDALEYDLVTEWDLQNLMQEECGKTELPMDEDYVYDDPATPVIWTSFITGKKPSEHGVETVTVWNSRFMNWFTKRIYIKYLHKPAKKVDCQYPSAPPPEQIESGKRKKKPTDILKRFGIYERFPEQADIRSDTIFDMPLRTIASRVPVYSPYEEAFPPAKATIAEALVKKGMYRVKWDMKCLKAWNERSKELLAYMEYQDKYDLLMHYFFTLDAVQHAFPDKLDKIKEWYVRADELAGKVREKLGPDTLFLIVSDHGQKKGLHTPYGFYSANVKLDLKNPKLTDFRWFIEKELKPEG